MACDKVNAMFRSRAGAVAMLSALACVQAISTVCAQGAAQRSEQAPAAAASSDKWRELVAPDKLAEYDALGERIGKLAKELNEKNSEVIRRYGRNSTPQAQAELDPIKDALRAAQDEQRKLRLCEKAPVQATALFAALKIRTRHPTGVPEDESIQGYLETRMMDGSLTEEGKGRFWKLVALRASLDASRGAAGAATAALLTCFGLDTPGPGPRPGMVSSNPILLAKRHADVEEINLYAYQRAHIGKTDGTFAPIAVTRERDILIIGTRSGNPPGSRTYDPSKSRPVVVKLGPAGQLVWERVLRREGFVDFEGASLGQAADGGYVAYIASYVRGDRRPNTRLVKLDVSGKTLWDRPLRGNGLVNTPHTTLARMMPNGSISLSGFILPTERSANAWTGEVSEDGKIVRDEVGARWVGPLPPT
jgi:hypothetical protein